MRAMRFNSNVSLDAWLFGEDGKGQHQSQSRSLAQSQSQPGQRPQRGAHSPVQQLLPPPITMATASTGGRGAAPGPGYQSAATRTKSLPVNKLTTAPTSASKRGSTSTTVLRPGRPSTSFAGNGLGKSNGSGSGSDTAPHRSGSTILSSASSAQPDLFPVSSKLRKLFRPNRLQWNRGFRGSVTTAEEKQRQLLTLSSASFQRLQGHVPFTLKEIVKDPKKLPYLLRWLSADDDGAVETNYHQVLLFLLEIEQLQLVAEEKRKEQALKIWTKYMDSTSEFQISSTLELTAELEALVRENIDDADRVLDAFFPIQKLAYTRLTREEMPRFLKSPEYLQMLIDTENDTESVPMERILEQPRAAHYFLLFLMQSRQHFELYFWLHVEYVLTPLLEAGKREAFWRLANVLLRKAKHHSQAITLSTMSDLQLAIDMKNLDPDPMDQAGASRPAARALFNRAQQEIFVMLRSSWFSRFMKSNLYKVALQDTLLHLARDASNSDSPPKLMMSRTFSSLERATMRSPGATAREDSGLTSDDNVEKVDNTGNTPKDSDSRSDAARKRDSVMKSRANATTGSDSTSNDTGTKSRSNSSSSTEEQDEPDFSKMVLNLESIIRLTSLPDGLQVHYRPHFEAHSTAVNTEGASGDECDFALDTVFTFSTQLTTTKATLKAKSKNMSTTKPTLILTSVASPHRQQAVTESFEDITRRVKAFLVPDGRILVRCQPAGSVSDSDSASDNSSGSDTDSDRDLAHIPEFLETVPGDVIFPFQQSGQNGFLYGCVYLTYKSLVGRDGKDTGLLAAKGICILSRFPLVQALRSVLEGHLFRASERADVFDPQRLAALLTDDISVRGLKMVSSLADVDAVNSRLLSVPLTRGPMDSRVDIYVKPLFDRFGTSLGLQILACALLECSVVFVASEYALLATCAEAVRCLLRPFAWCHVYAPVLPSTLRSYLQCPTPILVGLHSTYADRADLPSSGFYAVADMDRCVLEFVDPATASVEWRNIGLRDSRRQHTDRREESSSRIVLPTGFEVAKQKLDHILEGEGGQSCFRDSLRQRFPWDTATRPIRPPSSRRVDTNGFNGADEIDIEATEGWGDEIRIRLVCLELFAGILEGHAEACLVVGDTKESVVIFDETQFVATRPARDAPFYKALLRTQCFSEVVSAHRIDSEPLDPPVQSPSQ